MSGTASTSVTVGVGMGAGSGVEVGYGMYKPPFTAVQWQELEHQAMIYKYLVAGVPVPPDLVVPIRRSFEAISSRYFHHPSLGYCSYYGKKFDPEPGRCRRTDGKKWRCSKDAHPDSKYCERHMHRGRNRSRKPVESQPTSQPLPAAKSQMSTGCASNVGNFQGGGSGSFQNMPLYMNVGSEGSSFGSNATKLQVEPISYGIDNKEFRYVHGQTPDNSEHRFSPEASGSAGNLGLGSSSGTWRLIPSQVNSTSMLKHKAEPHMMGPTASTTCTFDAIGSAVSKQQMHQHCFLGSNPGGPSDPIKQEQQHPIHPFFSEWPTTRESWSALDDDNNRSNANVFSSTQLSISIPRASSNFSSGSAFSPNDA
ncbi:growth-regulating factor 3-like [Andrographis paniculata]|uniref:growth-regulating factor 3-like n=1 Tax=Andrographis paniculata TaxID=175694 RepID=UPI0021E7A7C8|nr:growth-regulating factor 3-like [Andrographis paniculata]XP_051137095.1 growth-regulating factor 3-like [Andrographis paniculata]XP_051137096.1 growth-regulating factor 3-like [Andrographis paniculata]XP_051137097.1 growth-regulating factor 3-like [Andrographis paniculata]XP_051137098.1 growth-regulating factor 3-like [Andrographis paniculata]XP_051137099.1 growth-regulating factor 3-like [Andrographis paniculata]